MALGAALGSIGIGSAIGGIAQAGASAYAAEKAAKMQIEWERERAKNAHQWEVQDLKAAGLNPILSAGGSGAVTSSINPQMPDFSGLGRISEASSAAKQAETAKKAQKAQEKLQNAEIIRAQEEAELVKNQAKNSALQADLQAAKNAAEIPALQTDTKYNTSKTGQVLRLIGQGSKDLMLPLNALGFGILGFGAKRAIGGAASALKAKTATQALKSAKPINNFPPNWKSPGLTPIEKWEHTPAMYWRPKK